MCASRASTAEGSSIVVSAERNRQAARWRIAVINLSSALAICFVLLGRFEPRFVFIHSYEALIYIAIVLISVFLDDSWLYAFAMLAPAGWLLLSAFTGGFGSIDRELHALLHLWAPNRLVFVLGDIIGFISAALMIVAACGWKRQLAKSGEAIRILLITLLIVATYDVGLLLWSLRAARSF